MKILLFCLLVCPVLLAQDSFTLGARGALAIASLLICSGTKSFRFVCRTGAVLRHFDLVSAPASRPPLTYERLE